MTVESVTYITDLDNTYPASGDVPSEGDDHIRNIKTGLAGTFPNFVGSAVTATEAELNILDGVTSTAAELNILDGVTATAAELNILDGVTATAAQLNLLAGKTSVATTQANTFHGNQTISSAVLTVSPPTNVSTVIEIGYIGGSDSLTVIDFHSGAVPVDYDVRISSYGGSGVAGGSWCNILALGLLVNGVTAATVTASSLTAGTLLDARVAQSNVTQHETALTITQSQISDLPSTQIAYKTADESVVSNATLQADDHLTVPVEANSYYEFELFFVFSCASLTPLIVMKIDGPTSSVVGGLWHKSFNGSMEAEVDEGSTFMYTAHNVNIAGEKESIKVTGFVYTAGTAGNLALSWAQNTSSADAVSIYKGGFLRVTKMG